MFVSDISIKRPIMMTMFLFVFVLFGALAYFGLPLDLMPQVDIPYVTITTVYPGAGPKEVETQISKKIEDAVSTISQIDKITSYSMESVSLVIVQFEMGKDANIAEREAKNKVDAILNEFASDVEKPTIEKIEVGSEPVVDVVLSGKMSSTELYNLADKQLKDRFSQINGVAKVDIIGGQEREIHIDFDNRVVFQNSISLPQVAQIVAAENMDMPGGNFKKNNQEITARLKGKFETIKEIMELEIMTPYGKKKLGDIANVSDSGEEIKQRSTFFNNFTKSKEDNVVLLSMIKTSDGNTVQIANDLIKVVPKIQEELPAGVNLTVAKDGSTFIKSSVEDTLTNIALGIVLTALVLLFFLHDLRSTFIVALSMPMSIISTFVLMQMAGFTMNMMTLMGLSTSVGVLVANSVVVLENIFRHKEMGNKSKKAAAKGTAEVVVAVFASTLTNIVVFLPIASMSSIVGQFFKEFALTVTFATIFSIVMSFTLTPMLASIILPDKEKKKHKIGDLLEKMFKSWENAYHHILKVIIKNRLTSFATLAITLLLFLGSFYFAAQISFEFFPAFDEGDINVEVELPQGFNLTETANLVNIIEKKLVQHNEVKQILTQLGKIGDMDQGTNLALMKVKLVAAEQRSITTNEAVTILTKDLSSVPNAMIRIAAVSSMQQGGEAPITFNIVGHDLSELEKQKSVVYSKIKEIPGLINLNTSSRSGKPEITLIPNRIKLADAGLTVSDLAYTLRAAMEGLTTTKYNDKGDEYDIRISLSDYSVDSPEKVANISVVSQKGIFKMSQLADIEFTEGVSKILHVDKAKSIRFSGFVANGFALGDIVNAINAELDKVEFKSGYTIRWAGDAEMMADTMVDMLMTFIIAILLTFMLLAAILESFSQPLMILGTIPLAMIGVFIALYTSGLSMGVPAMMGVIMLIGIVVNNGILLLDYTNILISKGKSVKEALIEACPTKLKPILMSTIAIILGMLPMALGIGSAGKEFRQPMGVVSIGGLIASTILTLFVIPAIFELTHREKKSAEGEE
ncbi:MAG: efflux RND transporter permease subunit [Melioribacteraceae bacterium]|nr:efflux RND transporter permease subunit [Melioribacteraceae bacterium]